MSNIYGTSGDDNPLNGTSGTDTVYGYDGDDWLYGEDGDDTLDGGNGTDIAAYNAYLGNSIIWMDISGYYHIQDTAGSLGTDDLYDVEQFYFTDTGVVDLSSLGLTAGGAGWGTAATVYGTSGSETLYGTAATDTFYGGGGNDTIYGYQGSDALIGEGGNDTLYGGDGDDSLYGGDGSDTLYGSDGDDSMDGGDGNDALYGGDGFNYLVGGDGDDSLHVGDGYTNYLTGGPGDDFMEGDGVADMAIYSYYPGVNSFGIWRGDDGDIYVQDFLDPGDGGLGLDQLHNIEYIVFDNLASNFWWAYYPEDLATLVAGGEGWGSTTTYGTSGNDTLYGTPVPDTIYGDDGNDIIYGYQSSDILYGGDGYDRIIGGAGNDYMDGGDGSDTVDYRGDPAGVTVDIPMGTAIDGWGGTDTLVSIENVYGSDYADTITLDDSSLSSIYGEGGDDTLTGGNSVNYLDGGTGADIMDGGEGYNYYWVDNTADVIIPGSGADQVYSSVTFTGADGVDGIQLTGSDDIDATGSTSTGVSLVGNSGDNVLTAGDGRDLLQGGDGVDTLTGGADGDDFVFEGANCFNNIDVITDYTPGSGGDLLDIFAWSFTFNPLVDTLSDFVSIATSGSDSILSADKDGAGTTYTMQQIALLEGVTGITNVNTLYANNNLAIG